jgi:hypothetical protein
MTVFLCFRVISSAFRFIILQNRKKVIRFLLWNKSWQNPLKCQEKPWGHVNVTCTREKKQELKGFPIHSMQSSKGSWVKCLSIWGCLKLYCKFPCGNFREGNQVEVMLIQEMAIHINYLEQHLESSGQYS